MILEKLTKQPDEVLARWLAWFRVASTPQMLGVLVTGSAREAQRLLERVVRWAARSLGADTAGRAERWLRHLDWSEVRLSHLLESKLRETRALPRAELLKRLQQELASTVGLTEVSRLDDPELNRRAIVAAAEHVGVDPKGRSLEALLEAITQRTVEHMVAQARQQLQRASPQEIARVERAVEDQIARMSRAEREALLAALRLETLSGQRVVEALRRGSAMGAGALAINAAGFSAYMALSSLLHGLFTGLLGVTLPFGVYMGASTLLAFFTGPIGIALLLGGLLGRSAHVGAWDLRRQLLAGLLTGLALAEPI